MNTLVIYFSKFGNTQKVAETIGEKCQSNGETHVLSLDDVKPADLINVDLVIMGSPTHRMNLPEAARGIFDQLPKRILKGKWVAAFDTSYKMNGFLSRFTAAKKLAQKLRKLGGKRVVPPETFHVMEREGPLYDGELERANTWAGLILQKAGNPI
jgi:flavodoxin